MQTPEPEDLRQISRAFFRSTMHRKLPAIRQALAEIAARKQKEQGVEVWIARESHCEDHTFIGVFSDADSAKTACEEFQDEHSRDHLGNRMDSGISWSDWRDRPELGWGILTGSTRYTGYVVHPATVGERWK